MFRLLAASLLCASAMHAQLATAVGVVVDSVLHPLLDEMGLALTTNKISYAPGATMAVVLATPSAQTWIGRHCSDAERQDGPDAIIGHVLPLTSDDPVTGALVHYSGMVIVAGKDVGFHHATSTRDASASQSGAFIICGTPHGALGTIRASKGRVSTGELPADLSSAALAAPPPLSGVAALVGVGFARRRAAGSGVFYLVDGYPYRFYRGAGQIIDDWPAASVMGIEYYQYGHIPAIWTGRSGGST